MKYNFIKHFKQIDKVFTLMFTQYGKIEKNTTKSKNFIFMYSEND